MSGTQSSAARAGIGTLSSLRRRGAPRCWVRAQAGCLRKSAPRWQRLLLARQAPPGRTMVGTSSLSSLAPPSPNGCRLCSRASTPVRRYPLTARILMQAARSCQPGRRPRDAAHHVSVASQPRSVSPRIAVRSPPFQPRSGLGRGSLQGSTQWPRPCANSPSRRAALKLPMRALAPRWHVRPRRSSAWTPGRPVHGHQPPRATPAPNDPHICRGRPGVWNVLLEGP
mmetsp:Transcript_88258/g.248480  ORF Transcript_88258/g.248480 Transcript_88258/m.248480 type:complete len:226 (+) Transcript_88258:181-858(+)